MKYFTNRRQQLTTHAAMADANDRYRAFCEEQSNPAPVVLGKPAPALPGR